MGEEDLHRNGGGEGVYVSLHRAVRSDVFKALHSEDSRDNNAGEPCQMSQKERPVSQPAALYCAK